MKEQILGFWVCASGSGQMCIFSDKPKRREEDKLWYGSVLGSLNVLLMTLKVDFPIMQWEDEPKQMTITIKF